jgi:hypothetical protein
MRKPFIMHRDLAVKTGMPGWFNLKAAFDGINENECRRIIMPESASQCNSSKTDPLG